MDEKYLEKLLNLNKVIPRRLIKDNDGNFVTATNQVVSRPVFYDLETSFVNIYRKDSIPDKNKPYFVSFPFLDKNITGPEANLILGYDYFFRDESLNIVDIELERHLMLKACYDPETNLLPEKYNSQRNAYYFERPSDVKTLGDKIDNYHFPIAFLHIPHEIYDSVSIDFKRDPIFKKVYEDLKKK